MRLAGIFESTVNVLIVTPRLPYPPLKGDQAVAYHRLRHLSGKHQLTLASFYETDEELRTCDELRRFCADIHLIRLRKWPSIIRTLWQGCRSKLPLQVLYYQSTEFSNLIADLLIKHKFDVLHTFMLRMAPYAQHHTARTVLELIDSMQLNLERRISREALYRRPLLREELRRIEVYERSAALLFPEVVVVSELDRRYLPGVAGRVIPLGVDTEVFKPKSDVRSSGAHRIVFSGNMNYAPNIHALEWFVEHCFSSILHSVPDATLIVAGTNPARSIRSLSRHPRVVVTGRVESMADIIRQCEVAIAPMISGSGMQFKILEAMACGIPVVTTTLGKGVIAALSEHELLVADDPGHFCRQVVSVLTDPRRAAYIGERARVFVEKRHSWASAANQIDEAYHRLCNQTPQPDPLFSMASP